MPELKVGALTYGAFLSMVLPPPVVWKDLGLVNSMDEPFSEENCIDLRNNLIYRTVADKVDMLRANFPGETVEQVIGHLEEQADVAAYIKTLDFPVDIVSCEYHTAYSNPELVNQLHAMGIQAAFWTVDTQDAVRSLLPLGPDCIVTNRPGPRAGMGECGNEEIKRSQNGPRAGYQNCTGTFSMSTPHYLMSGIVMTALSLRARSAQKTPRCPLIESLIVVQEMEGSSP